MNAALDQEARTALERFVQRVRRLLEEDLAREAEGRFGIHIADGSVEDEDGLHLDPSGLGVRRDLVEILEFLRGEEASGSSAVARLIREAAFTHLNRFITIRIAESIGLLSESLGKGPSSAGFKDLLEVAPLLAHDVNGGYWRYLQLCGDELAADLPQLFDPRNPLLELTPSPAAFDELVGMITSADLVEIWGAPDTLGWTYQFFNSGDERREMRDESDAPRDSRELAVRNQFFTPRYVVDFLTQNSLGRLLMEADPTSPLLDSLGMLLDPPKQAGRTVELGEVRILDPACGSGHFLLGAFDILERAWDLNGVGPEASAPLILEALWGIDIDSRCSQVAAAALSLRARRNCRAGSLPRPNVVTARTLPVHNGASDEVLAGLRLSTRKLVHEMREVLEQAPVLGSLLKVEERLASGIRVHVPEADGESTIFETMGSSSDAFDRAEAEVLSALRGMADRAESSPVERLWVAEATDAIRFVEASRQRYDVVLMNPPFGLCVPAAESYLRSAYAETWTELYAAFIERGIELLKPHGMLGAITSVTYFESRRMRELRAKLIDDNRPLAIVDLGAGVLQGATVLTALTVLRTRRSVGQTLYRDLTRVDVVEKGTRIAESGAYVPVDVSLFTSIDGHPFAFHIPEPVLKRWEGKARLEPGVAVVRTGGRTFDDERFVRAHWEIADDERGISWRFYQKGGEYRPYWSTTFLVLDWREDGRSLKEWADGRGNLAQALQSFELWGRAGLSFPRMSSVGFGVRIMPEGEVFADRSIAILPGKDIDSICLLALLNSTPIAELLQVFGRGRNTEAGAVKALPVAPKLVAEMDDVRNDVVELIDLFRSVSATDETDPLFLFPGTLKGGPAGRRQVDSDRRARAKELQHAVDTSAMRALGITDRIDSELMARSELLVRSLPDPGKAERQWAVDLMSYLVGAALGRWDVRLAQSERSLDPFASNPRLQPGRLVGLADDGYPISVPEAGLLLDEVGHEWDIAIRLVEVAAVLFDDSELVLADCLSSLGGKQLRAHIRDAFFKDHLARYSKSRRKAPIYWPLTVPSGKWGVWVYAPRLSRETLYAVASEALRREGHAEAEISRLERERVSGGAGRGAKALDKALDDERKLGEELRRFRQEAERIAGLGWEPDLDDGIVLCAAPLADLFPMWKEPAQYRNQLRAGKYEWSTVSKWADQL